MSADGNAGSPNGPAEERFDEHDENNELLRAMNRKWDVTKHVNSAFDNFVETGQMQKALIQNSLKERQRAQLNELKSSDL